MGFLGELKKVQILLYMPAYHHLYYYTLPFVNDRAHYCINNMSLY